MQARVCLWVVFFKRLKDKDEEDLASSRREAPQAEAGKPSGWRESEGRGEEGSKQGYLSLVCVCGGLSLVCVCVGAVMGKDNPGF